MQVIGIADIKKMGQICRLDYYEEEVLRKYLKKTKVQTLMIRDVLCQQQKQSNQIYYLLQGTVNLTISLSTHQRAILCQLGREQFLNLQIILNKGRSKYTIVVASSFIRFVVLQDKQIQLILSKIKEDVEKIYYIRLREISKKQTQFEQKNRKKRMQQHLNKLSLPNINFHSVKKQPILQISQSQGDQHSPQLYSHALKATATKSMKKLSPAYRKIQQQFNQRQQTQIQANSDRLVSYFNDHQDKIVQRKLQRLKSDRSISLHSQDLKDIDHSRSERIFKQNLKNIVKRKLLFERKHFKILRRFSNNPKASEQINFIKKYQQGNPIDNFFNL